MDGQRFDRLTKSLATGASRRSVLKGLFGLGGAAAVGTVLGPDTDARRSSSSAPTPTPACPGQTACPDSRRCCDTCNAFQTGCCGADTVPCTSNVTGCCAICDGYSCGLECCATAEQCCDGECCPDGSVCIGEERCCPLDLMCGGVCCNGEGQRCCGGVCIDAGQCCSDDECPDSDSTCQIGFCDLGSNTCSFRTPCDFAEAGTTCCGGECLFLGSSTNCLACGDTCAEGDVCCADGCQSLDTVDNCGACGTICTDDFACIAGTCQCDEDSDCGDGLICCDGACSQCCGHNVDNCDSNKCNLYTCNAGTCVASGGLICLGNPGFTRCFDQVCDPATGQCVDSTYRGDNAFCGPITQGNGSICCDGACTPSDESNCGTCGNICTNDFACLQNTCKCDEDSDCPGGSCLNGACCTGCAIAGVCYENGAINPSNQCQICEPFRNKTAWSEKFCFGEFSDCFGQVCDPLDGVCKRVNGPAGSSCQIFTIPANPCKTGACDGNGNCLQVDAQNGTACTATASTCSSGAGTCRDGACIGTPINEGTICGPGAGEGTDFINKCASDVCRSGVCVRVVNQPWVGNGCRFNEPNPCRAGVCTADGQCIEQNIKSPGDPCTGPLACNNYICAANNIQGDLACQFSSDTCKPAPGGCDSAVCGQSGQCEYTAPPSGERICEGIGSDNKPCCPNQVCSCPPVGDLFCLSKRCYDPEDLVGGTLP